MGLEDGGEYYPSVPQSLNPSIPQSFNPLIPSIPASLEHLDHLLHGFSHGDSA
jgi:hypothetical protein